jgi:hypothetical protein
MTEIEAQLRSELERLAPLPSASGRNWNDVLDRARSRRRRPLVRSHRAVVVAIALVLLIGGGVALAASTLLGADPLSGPAAPADNDAALRALFPPYRIGHATQLAEHEGRKLFGARTAGGGYCFSATSPIDPKGEGGHCVSKDDALKLDAGRAVAFTMSGGSAGGFAPGASEVHISGAGIDVTVPVAENGWWIGVAELPDLFVGGQMRSPLPAGQDRGFVVATSVGPDGRALGQARVMIVSVTRDKSDRVLTVGFGS